MPLLQRIIEHFQNLVLVSDISLMLMGISIIIMSAYYVYFIISKKTNYEDIIVKIGILVRVLMIIGLTIEFSHQKAIYHGSTISGLKYEALEQFTNYLFYGYIFVIGIYDIFTIGIDKFRGFFHTFDLTIISMPILYRLTLFIMTFRMNNDFFISLALLASLLILPYLFFNLYWKQNIKWFFIFLGYTITLLIIYRIRGISILFSSTLISYFLIGSYELGRKLFSKVQQKSEPNIWSKLKYSSIIVPIILIYFTTVTLNISPMVMERKYEINDFYRKDATVTSIEEAEKLARIALEDQTSTITHWQGKVEDFNNRYMFSLGDYSVQIDGATGKIFEIRSHKEENVKTKGSLSEEEIRSKTLKWLDSIGFTYDGDRHQLKIEQVSIKYNVSISNKFNDGSISNINPATVQWSLDGKLHVASIGRRFSNFKDYKDIKVNESVISENLKNWYSTLGEEMPPYVIDSFSYWVGELEPSINIRCKNNDSFDIDEYTGKILSFNRNINKDYNNKFGFNEELYNKYKARAEQLVENLSSNWAESNFELQKPTSYSQGFYSFISNNDVSQYFINVGLDLQGDLISFSQGSHYSYRLYSDKEFKISSSTALKLVAKEYKPFSIYSKRVKLAAEIKDNGEINYKWMVVVLPFKKVEHQIYYVDVNTGKITPLLEYKK